MRIIGIDPGLRRTGWGVIVAQNGKLAHVANGVCAAEGESLAQRLASLHELLRAVIALHRPEAAAVEHVFVNKDAVGTLKLAHARAIALLAPAEIGLDVTEYAPNAVKKAVVGVGHAEKKQVEHMVRMLLPGVKIAGADAADALAVAICHGFQAGSRAGRIFAGLQ